MDDSPKPPEGYNVYYHDAHTRSLWEHEGHVLMKYAVSFAIEKSVLGSGTLVSFGNHKGILTAKHVVDALVDNGPNRKVGLVMSFESHWLELPWGSWTIIFSRRGAKDSEGPDLALIGLPQRLLDALVAKKSFYPLGQVLPVEWEVEFMHLTWICIGSPEEISEVVTSTTREPDVLQANTLFTFPKLVSRTDRGEYDYLSLQLPAGTKAHPTVYGGMSGGSVWATRPVMDKNVGASSLELGRPRLLGVLFYQYDPDQNETILVAHGPHSLVEVAKSLNVAG